VPGLDIARGDERPWLVKDVIAGLVLSAPPAPQGVADLLAKPT
jgi:hypothetical protein